MHGLPHQAYRIIDVELLLDVLAMRLHGFVAEMQQLGDFLGPVPSPEQFEHLQFAVAEQFCGEFPFPSGPLEIRQSNCLVIASLKWTSPFKTRRTPSKSLWGGSCFIT